MADYTQVTFFAPKDALATGNPSKLIKGTEFDPEFSAIATAIATKYDSGDLALTGTFTFADTTSLMTPAVTKYALENGSFTLSFNGPATLGSAAASDDLVYIYDTSAAIAKKITVTNLVAGTGFVPNARTLTAGGGLTGTGDLSADRTFAVGAGLGIVVNADSVEVDEGSGLTFSGNALVVNRNPSNALDSVGFMQVPQNAQGGNYTLVSTDAGKHIYHDTGDGAGDTYTIPANASVAYPVGTVLTWVNNDSNNVSIAINSDTLILAGTTSTGTRTLGQNGVASALKITSTKWLISGTALT